MVAFNSVFLYNATVLIFCPAVSDSVTLKILYLSTPQVESLYPSELGPDAVSTKDFLESGLVQLDKSMEERIRAASSRGNVLRYVCEIESAGYASSLSPGVIVLCGIH
jgi:hypothetical protein